jgi:hypothetical protein
MFVLFRRITNPPIAFLAVLFYALSTAFLGYADSLANQPIDDLLRFGFMLAVVLSTRAATETLRHRWLAAAWVMEFCLSLVSFDSVFFLYVWLIGWDWVEGKGFRWKRYLLFSIAPVSAHGLQFLQNVWYLGFTDAVRDIKDAFLLKHGSVTDYNLGQGRAAIILTSLWIIFENIFRPLWLLVPSLALYAAFVLVFRPGSEFPSLKLLMVLFLAGLSFVLVLPHAARMPYEARQMLPFSALLMGALTRSSFLVLMKAVRHEDAGGEFAGVRRVRIAVPYVLLTMALLLVAWSLHAADDRTSVYELGNRKEEMQFAQQLTGLQTRYEPVYFDSGAFSLHWDPNYVPGYPQILPLTEYYAGSRPILCFQDPEKIADDLVTMVRRSSVPFSPVILAQDPERLAQTVNAIERSGVLKSRPLGFMENMGRFAIDLTDHIDWRGNEADPDPGNP